MKKKVLYISYDGMTDPLGQSQVLPYLLGLSDSGFEINLISFEKKSNFNDTSEIIKKLLSGSHITWYPLNYTKTPPVFSTLYDLFKMYKKAKAICHKEDISIVHCRSYISSLIGLKLKRELGVKLIFDMRGFWADERVDGNIWSLRNPVYKSIYKFFKKQEKNFLRESDKVISLTHIAKAEMLSWGIIHDSAKIVVIPCCMDDNLFVPGGADEELKKKLSLVHSEFVLSYLGSIGTWYLLEEMLMFFKKLLETKKNAKFLFITSDSKEKIVNAASEVGVDPNSIVIVKAARKEVPEYLKLSQASVFFIKPMYSKKASSPTKLAEVLSMGIPVIGNANVGDTEELITKEGVGYILTDFSEQSYKSAVDSIDGLLQIPKEKIRAVALGNFTLAIGIKTYKSVYDSLLKN